MQLYAANSPKAIETITTTAKRAFGFNSKAVAYIAGRSGNKCQTMSGTGRTNFDWCETSYTFFCEFIDKGKTFAFYYHTFFFVYPIIKKKIKFSR
jgi:hypothetical protein